MQIDENELGLKNYTLIKLNNTTRERSPIFSPKSKSPNQGFLSENFGMDE